MLNSLAIPPPRSGLTMNMCAVAGLALIGTRRDAVSSFLRALANHIGLPQSAAPLASASYSRERDIAIWIRAMTWRRVVKPSPKGAGQKLCDVNDFKIKAVPAGSILQLEETTRVPRHEHV